MRQFWSALDLGHVCAPVLNLGLLRNSVFMETKSNNVRAVQFHVGCGDLGAAVHSPSPCFYLVLMLSGKVHDKETDKVAVLKQSSVLCETSFLFVQELVHKKDFSNTGILHDNFNF